jgi:hypothetical protein
MADTNLTPLERLEAWVLTDPLNRLVTMMVDPPSWSVELNDIETHVTHEGTAPTLDAAILAALAQAEEAQNG